MLDLLVRNVVQNALNRNRVVSLGALELCGCRRNVLKLLFKPTNGAADDARAHPGNAPLVNELLDLGELLVRVPEFEFGVRHRVKGERFLNAPAKALERVQRIVRKDARLARSQVRERDCGILYYLYRSLGERNGLILLILRKRSPGK